MGSHPTSGGYKYRGLVLRGLTTLPCKKENVEKPPRNQPDFVEEAKVLSWAVEPRKEEKEEEENYLSNVVFVVQIPNESIFIHIFALKNKCYE
jgi:hypothetical protein